MTKMTDECRSSSSASLSSTSSSSSSLKKSISRSFRRPKQKQKQKQKSSSSSSIPTAVVSQNSSPLPLDMTDSSIEATSDATTNNIDSISHIPHVEIIEVIEAVFENQRSGLIGGFSVKWLLPGLDSRGEWSDFNDNVAPNKIHIGLPPPVTIRVKGNCEEELVGNWEWTTEWCLDTTYCDCDSDGWSYAFSFWDGKWYPSSNPSTFVRRRKWNRYRKGPVLASTLPLTNSDNTVPADVDADDVSNTTPKMLFNYSAESASEMSDGEVEVAVKVADLPKVAEDGVPAVEQQKGSSTLTIVKRPGRSSSAVSNIVGTSHRRFINSNTALAPLNPGAQPIMQPLINRCIDYAHRFVGRQWCFLQRLSARMLCLLFILIVVIIVNLYVFVRLGRLVHKHEHRAAIITAAKEEYRSL